MLRLIEDKQETFVIDSRMQEATTHAPRTITTHEEPTDRSDKRLLASGVFDLTIFTVIILNCEK